MAIVFKTYNGRHQLHFYGENWILKNSKELKDLLSMFDRKNASKLVVKESNSAIEILLNEMIVDCKDVSDLKKKFGEVADLKERFQKLDEKKENNKIANPPRKKTKKKKA